jgi:hypothetical protein
VRVGIYSRMIDRPRVLATKAPPSGAADHRTYVNDVRIDGRA